MKHRRMGVLLGWICLLGACEVDPSSDPPPDSQDTNIEKEWSETPDTLSTSAEWNGGAFPLPDFGQESEEAPSP